MKILHTVFAAAVLLPALAFADAAPTTGDGMDGMKHHQMMGGRGGPGEPGGNMGMEMHMGRPGGGHSMMGMLHGLGLDEAQKDKIFAIHHAQAPALRQASKSARAAHEELHKLVMSGKFDEAKAKTLADASGRAVAEMALLHAKGHAQVMAVLTDEQRKKLDTMKNHMQGGHPGMQHGD
jgi:Spy/CpxP family protein refolding chaperone